MDAVHDLIIVGAGTAGCVLGERLTSSGKLRVLLIEAGGSPRSRFVSIPAGFAKLFRSKLDWAFEGWVAAGASGWGWEDVLPVFQSQERWLGPDGSRPRGHDGPMEVSPNRNVLPLSRAFVGAARRAGLGEQLHHNGDAYEGAWICELAHRDGKRFSAYDGYLRPAMRRPNLEIVTDAHVTRVLFEQGRATGVSALRGGVEQTFKGRGVVLAAGAFGSPQLLMLSGIGPTETLESLGIRVRLSSPDVGAQLQDHPTLPIVFRTRGHPHSRTPSRRSACCATSSSSRGCWHRMAPRPSPSRRCTPNRHRHRIWS
jgi:choline dehydrogenase